MAKRNKILSVDYGKLEAQIFAEIVKQDKASGQNQLQFLSELAGPKVKDQFAYLKSLKIREVK